MYVFESSAGSPRAAMTINKYGHGSVSIHPRDSTQSRAIMSVNEFGNGAVSIWDEDGYRLADLK